MTEVQERLMTLMDEINFICQKEKLQYVLINETAIRAEKKHQFSDARIEFKILMPIGDIAKLQAYVNEHSSDSRSIESWENNSLLYQMVFRYVDKNSLLIDGPAGHYLRMPGIAITIYPARPARPANQVVGAERYLQQINNNAGRMWRDSLLFLKLRSHKARKYKKATQYCADHMFIGRMRYLLTGRDGLAQWIMKHQDMQETGETDAYWYMKKNSHMVKMPGDLFTNVKWIEFEGRQVCVSCNPENHRVDKVPNQRVPMSTSIRVICECDLPYAEYLDFIQDKKGPSLKELMRHYQEYTLWMGRIYRPMEEKVSHTFLGVRRSVDRIDVWYALRGKREALKEAYEKKDIAELEKLLKTYLDKTDMYLKGKVGFYIDAELFQYAKLVWESRGKDKYAGRVYKLVPELYKKETVEDYLAKAEAHKQG